MDEFINSQKNMLGISDFLQNAKKYTQESFPDLDMNDLFTSAISGSISNNFWTNSILDFARTRNKVGNPADDYSIDSYNNSQYF